MNKTYDDVIEAFRSGSVLGASKSELEQLLLAVARARVLDPINQATASQMGETMRQLLATRQSAEMHGQAIRVSTLALWVSAFALLVSLAQVAVSVVRPSADAKLIPRHQELAPPASRQGSNNSFKPKPLRGSA